MLHLDLRGLLGRRTRTGGSLIVMSLVNESIVRRNKREANIADKIVIAPGISVGQLRRFRAALIGPLSTSCRV